MRLNVSRLISAIGFVALTASMSNAQPYRTSLMFGPFVGVNHTTVRDTGAVEDPGHRTGLAAGAQLQADFGRGVFFRTALLYSMRGATSATQGTNLALKMNYLEVPAVFGISFPLGPTVRPFIMGGGQIGFRISCKLQGTQSGIVATIDCDDIPDSDFSSIDFGALGGGGVMFPAAGGTLSFDARYYHGLQKIEDQSEAKNRGWTAALAFMIPIAITGP